MTRTVLMLCLSALVPAGAHASSCRVERPWVPVVELYTSEGCSSCPPAEAWLGSLAEDAAAHRVVPLAFHVDYWNYIGWTDPFARAEYSARQRRLSQAEGGSVVYTPQVRLAGDDFRGWRSAEQVRERIARSTPATGATVDLRLDLAADRLRVDSQTRLPPHAVAYLALYERTLASDVRSGENAGRRLNHDFVVRTFAGPFTAGADGTFSLHHDFVLGPGWKRADLGVALIQASARSGAGLLAASASACPG